MVQRAGFAPIWKRFLTGAIVAASLLSALGLLLVFGQHLGSRREAVRIADLSNNGGNEPGRVERELAGFGWLPQSARAGVARWLGDATLIKAVGPSVTNEDLADLAALSEAQTLNPDECKRQQRRTRSPPEARAVAIAQSG